MFETAVDEILMKAEVLNKGQLRKYLNADW